MPHVLRMPTFKHGVYLAEEEQCSFAVNIDDHHLSSDAQRLVLWPKNSIPPLFHKGGVHWKPNPSTNLHVQNCHCSWCSPSLLKNMRELILSAARAQVDMGTLQSGECFVHYICICYTSKLGCMIGTLPAIASHMMGYC